MKQLGKAILREIRKALPSIIFFFFLFHMISLTQVVLLDDYSMTALRAAGATIGALLVAKAILVVDVLPITRLSNSSRAVQNLWKTFLYGIMILVFKILEETIHFMSKNEDMKTALATTVTEINWPIVSIIALWVFAGLFLYCVISDLVEIVGARRAKAMFFERTND